MNFELTEEQKLMCETARNFARNRITPLVKEDEKVHRFRPELVREMGELGFFGAIIDEAYGGTGAGFGNPISSYQMIQADLVQMFVEHEAAKLLVLRAAASRDAGNLRNGLEVSTAKYFAGEAAVHAANTAMKILGSYGFSNEYPVGCLLRDAKSFQIVEGTSNIQKMIIARNLIEAY